MSPFRWFIGAAKRRMSLSGKGKFTCGRRLEAFNPAFRKDAGLDQWERRGDDLCCSYCGSMHPEEVRAIAKSIVAGSAPEGTKIDWSDKSYKLYVTRQKIANATMGGIKFYMQHAPIDSKDGNRYEFDFVKLLCECNKISATKWQEKMKEKN
jgi:hypothetical protein